MTLGVAVSTPDPNSRGGDDWCGTVKVGADVDSGGFLGWIYVGDLTGVGWVYSYNLDSFVWVNACPNNSDAWAYVLD